jgi:hypothetical protein
LAQRRAAKLSLVAATVMALSYRQAKRLWKHLPRKMRRKEGASATRPTLARAKDAAWRAAVVARVRERYRDFGPTLAAAQRACE